jgi:hypothetical protein
MHTMQSRRDFLAMLSAAGAAGVFGAGKPFADEAPPETTTIRLAKTTSICIAPGRSPTPCCARKGSPTSGTCRIYLLTLPHAANWILASRAPHGSYLTLMPATR